jgi:hypothetical protein
LKKKIVQILSKLKQNSFVIVLGLFVWFGLVWFGFLRRGWFAVLGIKPRTLNI